VLGLHVPAFVGSNVAPSFYLNRNQSLPAYIGDQDIGVRDIDWCKCGNAASSKQLAQNIVFASGTDSGWLATALLKPNRDSESRPSPPRPLCRSMRRGVSMISAIRLELSARDEKTLTPNPHVGNGCSARWVEHNPCPQVKPEVWLPYLNT
jgi:hypothetical protein